MIVRQFVVESYVAGEHLPMDRSLTYIKEPAEAIVELRKQVFAAVGDAVAKGKITSAEGGEAILLAQSVMIAQVLDLNPGQATWVEVAGKVYHILDQSEFVPDGVVQSDADEVLSAVRGEAELANSEVIEVALDAIRIGLRETKIEMLAGMFEYATATWRKLPEELSEGDLAQRSGFIHGILVAAGVPYAVAGEMRPSKEWSNAFETVRTLILDAGLDPTENATWLVDLHKSEAAPATQPDFAEQPRPTSAEVGGDTREVNAWFRGNTRFDSKS